MDNTELLNDLSNSDKYTPYISGNTCVNITNITKNKQKIPQATLCVDEHLMPIITCNRMESVYTSIISSDINVHVNNDDDNRLCRIRLSDYLKNIYRHTSSIMRRKNVLINPLELIYFRSRCCFLPKDYDVKYSIFVTCALKDSYLCIICTQLGTTAVILDSTEQKIYFNNANKKALMKDKLDTNNTDERNLITIFYIPIYIKTNYHRPIKINNIKCLDQFEILTHKHRKAYLEAGKWIYNLSYMGTLATDEDIKMRQHYDTLEYINVGTEQEDTHNFYKTTRKISFSRNQTIPIIAETIHYDYIDNMQIRPKTYSNNINKCATLYNSGYRPIRAAILEF